jgi:hypothetical protein
MVDKARECTYDVKWQVMRMHLMPKFETAEGTNEAILELLAYIGKAADDYWKFVRVWRVQNLLSSVKARLDQLNKTGFKEHIQVRKALKGLELEYQRYLNKRPWVRGGGRIDYSRTPQSKYSPFKKWNWDKVRADLVSLQQKDPETFAKLYRLMNDKLVEANRRRVALDLPEMYKFVTLIRDTDLES